MPIERIEKLELASEKVESFQKKYNVNQKKITYIIGKNLTLFVCMLIPLVLISTVWMELGAVIFQKRMLLDGLITVSLFICGEMMMIRLGCDGGKLDSDHVLAKTDFEKIVAKVMESGSMLLGVFCDWQIDIELEQAVNHRLKMLRMTPKMWDDVKNLRPDELVSRFGKKKAKKMMGILNLQPIELNEAILLYNGEYEARGGIPESGNAYIQKKRHIIETVVACTFAGLLTVSVVFALTSDVTLARVVYTVFKLTILLYRMWRGYDRGSRAFNTYEVRMLKAKTNYLKQYLKFVEDKIYLNLGDKYGDISQFVGVEIKGEET